MIFERSEEQKRRDSGRLRYHVRPQWRRIFVPVWYLQVEGFGRIWVVCHRLETRWSYSARRRLWRVPH